MDDGAHNYINTLAAAAEEADSQAAGVAPAETKPAETTPADAKAGKPPGALRRLWHGIARRADITWRFTKELFNDHTFWVKALAVKGGASAILASVLVGAAVIVNMPILASVAIITAGVGLIGAGIYGIAAGGAKAWEGLQDVYARVTGRAPPEHVYKERKDIFQRLAETKFLQRIAEKKWAKKITATHAWKTTMKYTRRSEDSMLGGIAVGGALISLAVGAFALPVVMAGSLLTAAAVIGVSSIVSGMTGLYFSITGIREEVRMKRAHMETTKQPKPSLIGLMKGPQSPDDESTPFEPIGHSFIPEAAAAEAARVAQLPAVTPAFDKAATAEAAAAENPPKPLAYKPGGPKTPTPPSL